MKSKAIRCIGAVTAILTAWVWMAGAVAQPQYVRTVIVDQTSSAADRNFTKIQDAINSVNARPETEEVWTILVYLSVYAEAITLRVRK